MNAALDSRKPVATPNKSRNELTRRWMIDYACSLNVTIVVKIKHLYLTLTTRSSDNNYNFYFVQNSTTHTFQSKLVMYEIRKYMTSSNQNI